MSTTTTAAVLRDPEAVFTLEDVRLDDIGPTEVLVRIVGVGFCHTDVIPRDLAAYALPAILGHEGSGIVVEVGSDVTEIQPGDHVVLSFAFCGECQHCRAGHPAYCVNFMALNMSARNLDGSSSAIDADGAPLGNRWFGQSSFAHHAIVDQRGVVRVDPDLPLELMGPLGCGIQTGTGAVLRVMNVQPGQSVVIFGAGAVGLAAIMAAKVAGAGDIVAVDVHQNRLDLASELGATRVVLANDPDADDAILNGSLGLDYALDTTGVEDVMSLATTVVGVGGMIVLVGASMAGFSVHPTQLTGKTVTYILEGDADPHEFIPELIAQWKAGRFPFDRLISTFPFEQINEAEAASKSGQAIKPVLIVSEQ